MPKGTTPSPRWSGPSGNAVGQQRNFCSGDSAVAGPRRLGPSACRTTTFCDCAMRATDCRSTTQCKLHIARDRIEGRGQAATHRIKGGNRGDRDQGGDKTVLNRGRAAVIAEQASNTVKETHRFSPRPCGRDKKTPVRLRPG